MRLRIRVDISGGMSGWAVADRVLFRPLFGWCTAWSFDRLRLWLEQGVRPERSRDQALTHAAAVAGLAGVWLYQGFVPKLWKIDSGEVRLWRQALGLGTCGARVGVRMAGFAEAAFGVVILAKSDKKWPFVTTAADAASRGQRMAGRSTCFQPGVQPGVIELGRRRARSRCVGQPRRPTLGKNTVAKRS